MAAILAMAAIGVWAFGTERLSYVVTSGISMNPIYYADDLVIVMKADSYEIGQIAAYHGPQGLAVLHRIIGGDAEAGFVLKGDNNPEIDFSRPAAGELIGHAVLHVPKGGVWLRPLLSPTGLGMLGFLIIGAGATATVTRRDIPRGRRKKKVKAMSRGEGSWSTAAVLKAVSRLPVIPRVAAALAAVVALVAIVLGVLGWMKPATVTEAVPPEARRTMTFSYSATVPRSAAYDGTTVTSPDPIFRRLTNRVDLRMRYQGPPGTFDAVTELSTSSGWHTTLDLVPAKKFSTSGYDATASLDLVAFDRRAKAAADATGIPATDVTVTVKARVTGNGVAPFVAPLQFDLGPLQLLLDNSAALTYGGADQAGTEVAREIWLFGITAGSARAWAAFLLIVAVITALAIVFLAWRAAPVRTRSEIERRYPELIVPVEPMASPPGKPVVNVDNFPALVKLAERYGQMILTWSRPDADDFVVRDEGITYRYRTGLEDGDGAGPPTLDDGIPPRSRRRVSAKGVLTGTEDRPTSHRYPS